MFLVTSRLAFWQQPIVDLATGHVISVEWLARARGDDSAVRLWQAATQLGLIARYEYAILQHLVRVRRVQHDPRIWHINLHPQGVVRSIGHYPDVWGRFTRDLSPVVWELLEVDHWRSEDIAALTRVGGDLALDDWGDGPGTSTRLTQWPIRRLKLDWPLIQRAMHEVRAGAWVQAVQAYAAAQGIMVIAEGLETVDHVEVAKELGIRYGQGWACGVPALVR
ncbi:EAL domain-containing protein [Sulfobacillus sp. hq2]|uniref:EAL domain-containing protein n=1 Tax=Sulfobacillus TaxID=28033 RepID=UPI001304C655|nr:EAL domain-containing protein [Sulfobacillus sp. hq2]